VRDDPDDAAKMKPLYDLLRQADRRLLAQERDTALSTELQKWARSPAVITSGALREVLDAISARLTTADTDNLVSIAAGHN